MNEHPLSDNLTDLSYDDLEKRLTELNKRWYTAKRMNMDPSVLHQLDIMLQGLEAEKMRRAMTTTDTGGEVINTDWKDHAKKS
jgi:hypothetical protein